MTAPASSIDWLVGHAAHVPQGDGWLTDHELLAQRRYTVSTRRADWRLGRWIAKHAVSAWLATRGRHIAPGTIGVLARGSDDGFPILEGVQDPVPALSLSHRDGIALCAVADGSTQLGCDLERIEPRADRFPRDWFTEAEQEQVANVEPSARDELVTLVWSAKESVLKAIGEGLRRDTRSVNVDLAGWCSVGSSRPGWQPISARDLDGERYRCWVRREGAHLMTVATEHHVAARPHELTAMWTA